MPAAIIPAIIMAGSSVASSAIQAHAAGKATKQLQGAGQAVIDRTGQMYDPYRSVGTASINSLGDMMGLNFEHIGFTPSSQLPQGQGQAVPRSTVLGQRPAQTQDGSSANRRTPQASAGPDMRDVVSDWDGIDGRGGRSVGEMGQMSGDEFMRQATRSSYGSGPIYDQSGREVARS